MKVGLFDHIEYGERPLAQLYDERLQFAQAAEAAGIYCLHLAEHHATPLCLVPVPGVFLGALARATTLFFNTMRTGSVLAGVASGFVAAAWGYRAVFVFCVLLASTASVVLFIFNYQRGAKIFSDPHPESLVQDNAVTAVAAGERGGNRIERVADNEPV